MNKKIEPKKKGENKLALGASLAALAAGAYFLLGPDGKKNQKHLRSWAIKIKGDVLEKLEQAKEVSEPAYHQIIDTVAAKHEKAMKVAPAEIKTLAKDLKSHWSKISQPLMNAKKPVATKKPAIKALKKVVKAKKKLSK